MPTISPWLVPPNFLAAAEAGAKIGLEQAQQAQQAPQAAGQLGLGYAQLGAENYRAAQAGKDADARLALEQNRLNLATTLGTGKLDQGNQTLDLGEQKLKETQAQHTASNDLTKQKIDMGQQRIDNLENYRDQEIQIQMSKTANSPNLTYAQRLERANKVVADGVAAYSDPEFETNPQAVMARYPMAMESKIVQQALASQNVANRIINRPLPPTSVEAKVGGANVKTFIDPNQASSVLNSTTNRLTPFLQKPKTSPLVKPAAASGQIGNGPAAPGYSIGATYNGGLIYLGGDPNNEANWQKKQ